MRTLAGVGGSRLRAAVDPCGIRALKTVVRTPPACRNSLADCNAPPISTGPLIRTNNKIKTLKRQACGFRDEECFHLKTQALHRSRITLVA